MAKNLTDKEFETITEGYDNWTSVTGEVVYSHGRWSNLMTQVFYNSDEDKYIRVYWSVGATEYQDVDLNPSYITVEPVEEVRTVYKAVRG